MKALTLWQPWATLVAMKAKKVETRTWATKYRGEIAIHSAQLKPTWLGRSAESQVFRDELAEVFNCRMDRDDRSGPRIDDVVGGLPRGSVLCIVKLVGIEQTHTAQHDLSDRELVFGNYEDGRYAWFFEMVEQFDEPIPAKGNRMLWNWNAMRKVR